MPHKRLADLLERIIKNIGELEKRVSITDDRIVELEQLLDKIEAEKTNEVSKL